MTAVKPTEKEIDALGKKMFLIACHELKGLFEEIKNDMRGECLFNAVREIELVEQDFNNRFKRQHEGQNCELAHMGTMRIVASAMHYVLCADNYSLEDFPYYSIAGDAICAFVNMTHDI